MKQNCSGVSFSTVEQRQGRLFHAARASSRDTPVGRLKPQRFRVGKLALGSGHPLIDARAARIARHWLTSPTRVAVGGLAFITSWRSARTWGARRFEWWLIAPMPPQTRGNWAYLGWCGSVSPQLR